MKLSLSRKTLNHCAKTLNQLSKLKWVIRYLLVELLTGKTTDQMLWVAPRWVVTLSASPCTFVRAIVCFTFLCYFLIKWELKADYACKCSVFLISHLLKLKKKKEFSSSIRPRWQNNSLNKNVLLNDQSKIKI